MENVKRITEAVRSLAAYAVHEGLICREEVTYAANSIFDVLGITPDAGFHAPGGEVRPLKELLDILLDDAVERGVIDGGIASRDLFDTKIMGCITPRPGEVIRTFRAYLQEDPKKATDYFYKLAGDSDYIRRYRIEKDQKWLAPTRYGDLDITINLSKPEKDPKAIAAALTRKGSSYPQCLLCPLREDCLARQHGTTAERPVMIKAEPIPHYIVTAALIPDETGKRFLLTKRPAKGLLGGMWEFPGGKQETGETLEECICREIREELGITIRAVKPFGVYKHAYTHFKVTLHAFCCEQLEGDPQPLAADELGWFTREEMQDLPMGKIDRMIAQKLKVSE